MEGAAAPASDSGAATSESGAMEDEEPEGGSPMMMMKCEPMVSGMKAKQGRGMMPGDMTGERDGGHGMMVMGKGMRGGMMGHGMMAGGEGAMAHDMAHHELRHLLSVGEVTKRLEAMIAGHKRLKVAKVEPGGDFSFAVDITTVDGSLVHRLLVDRRDGMVWDAE
jgi:hypothetical protein